MDYKFGIEEEFFVTSAKTGDLDRRTDEAFLKRAKELTSGAVKRELLQSQVEAATPVCSTFAEAREHLRRLRSGLGRAGRETGRAIIAAGTHPTGEWRLQERSLKERYDHVVAELRMLAQRNLVSGLHVHVEMPDPELRIDVMARVLPFLPILLALSASSPFWQGCITGFASYRCTSYDEMPRTGLPPLFTRWADYLVYTSALEEAGIIKDPSYIWWSIRPSSKYPTLELRIADACTSLEDALTIAALYRCLVRRLVEQPSLMASIGPGERALVKENKWRAQRFGIRADFVSPFGERGSTDAASAARRLVEQLRDDAIELDCLPEIERVEIILGRGTSADRQMAIYAKALGEGASEEEALARVSTWLREESLADCGSLAPLESI
jgi:carboxylate-amine ligase